MNQTLMLLEAKRQGASCDRYGISYTNYFGLLSIKELMRDCRRPRSEVLLRFNYFELL